MSEPDNVAPDELRLLCPCGTIFTTVYTEPDCPSCGGVLQIRYKRGTAPKHPDSTEKTR